jgi:hypothetical protein
MLVLHTPCFWLLTSGSFDEPNALLDAVAISRFTNAGSPLGNAALETQSHCREFRKLYGRIPLLPVFVGVGNQNLPVSKTELPHFVEWIPIHPVHILVIIGSDLELFKSV